MTSTPPEQPTDPWASPATPGGRQPDADPPTAALPQPDTGGSFTYPPPYGSPSAPPYGSAYPPTYGPAYGSPAPDRSANGLGTAALVLGILAVLSGVLLIGALFGIVAIVVGLVARSRAKRGRATNGGVALTGALLGLLGVVLAAAVLTVVFRVFATPISDYRDCLSRAGTDSSAQQICTDRLRRDIDRKIGR